MMPLFIHRSIDHSTIAWAMKRLPLGYLAEALGLLHLETSRYCHHGVFIAESTGVKTDRYETRKVRLE